MLIFAVVLILSDGQLHLGLLHEILTPYIVLAVMTYAATHRWTQRKLWHLTWALPLLNGLFYGVTLIILPSLQLGGSFGRYIHHEGWFFLVALISTVAGAVCTAAFALLTWALKRFHSVLFLEPDRADAPL